MAAPEHIQWFKKSRKSIKSKDGLKIEIWEFNYKEEKAALSEWAKHFRTQYSTEEDIARLRYKKTPKEYLNDLIFPSENTNLGRSTRAGDFGEILMADFLEWIKGHWVPRVRWNQKINKDTSSTGSDIIGFHFHRIDRKKDKLSVMESKTKFSSNGKNRLQDAVTHSDKDVFRIPESVNYIKRRFNSIGMLDAVSRIERFQNYEDDRYIEEFYAVALISDEHFKLQDLKEADAKNIEEKSGKGNFKSHTKRDVLNLLVIKAPKFMDLVNKLYRIAADEA